MKTTRTQRKRTQTIYAQHTVQCFPDGKIHVQSLRETVCVHKAMDDGNLRALLRDLSVFVPADQFSHVVQQLRTGRIYLLRDGPTTTCRFLT